MPPENPINPSSVLSDYFDYVEQYRRASALLDASHDVFWPKQQVRGQLVELALKTYLCTTDHFVRGHNLEVLANAAVERDLQLTEKDWSERIVKLNSLYFRHTDLDAKFLSRYPMPDRPTLVTVTPGHAVLDDMIGRIVEQARARRN